MSHCHILHPRKCSWDTLDSWYTQDSWDMLDSWDTLESWDTLWDMSI